jgi:hypothetical protein
MHFRCLLCCRDGDRGGIRPETKKARRHSRRRVFR